MPEPPPVERVPSAAEREAPHGPLQGVDGPVGPGEFSTRSIADKTRPGPLFEGSAARASARVWRRVSCVAMTGV